LRTLYGVKGEGLTMTLLPVMREEMIFRFERMTGKFQGQIAPTMPRGWCVVTILTWSSSNVTSSFR
jgi:hypothetical protein